MAYALAKGIEPLEPRVLLSSYTLHRVGYFGANLDGATPNSPLVADAIGNIFGTTAQGGTNGLGTVFEIARGTNSILPLASFHYSDGAEPFAGVTLDAQGNLYGSTRYGGNNKDGVVFELSKGAHSVTPLASFGASVAPFGDVTVDSSGNVFGVTEAGGANNLGFVFEVVKGSHAVTVLYSFTRGLSLAAVISDASGDLFSVGAGGIYEIGKGNTSPSLLVPVSSSISIGLVLSLDAQGNLYGTTYNGGASGSGSIFEIASGTTAMMTVANFGAAQAPAGALTFDVAGNIFGTTPNPTNRNAVGTIFKVSRGSGIVTNLATINGQLGSEGFGGIALDPDGNIFGTSGERGNQGYVFELPSGSSVPTPLAYFSQLNGSTVFAGVSFGPDGNLYGDNAAGVFEITKCGQIPTLLARFGVRAQTLGGITVDSSGDLFGTTVSNGTHSNAGTVFEIPRGATTINTMYAFQLSSNDGAQPGGNLVVDQAGNIFGATEFGGPANDGTVFEIPAGTNQVVYLHAFFGGDGAYPESGIIMDAAGNLFGTTSGRDVNDGTVFEITAGTHTFSTIAAFDGTNGGGPNGLTLDSSGNLYGTTKYYGPGGYGTIFEIPKATHTIQTLATVYQTLAGVRIDAAGNLFGTQNLGGDYNQGTVYELAKGSNRITTLISFDGINGAYPTSGVTLDAFGDLYGTTESGGFDESGTYYELSPVRIPSRLAFAQQPTGTIAGKNIDPPVKVYVEDQHGNVVTTDNSTVTLSINSGPANAALGGTFTTQADDGVVTFDNLELDAAGAYTLAAADASLTGAVSDPFTVTPAAPAKLAFISAPSAVTVGEPISGLQVAVEDRFNNITGSADPVNIAINLAGGSFTPDSILTASTDGGIATFNQLITDTAGAFTIEASGGGLTGADSPIFVTPAATSLSLIQPIDATYGDAGASVSATVAAVSPSAAPVNEGTVTFTLQESGGATISVPVPVVNGSATAVLPIAGLDAGAYSLSASYHDGAIGNFHGSTAAPTTLVIDPAHLSVSANSVSRVYGYDNPPLLGSVSGIRNGDPITASYSTAAAASSTVRTYSIAATLSDNGSGKLAADYVVDSDLTDVGTLTVLPADASVRYTGQTIISTGSPSATAGGVTLQAALQDLDGGPAATIAGAKVQFDVYDAGGTLVGQYGGAIAADPANAKSGTATASASLAAGSYQVVVELLSSDSYQYAAGVTAEQAALTVVQPVAGQSIHGAGQFVNLAQFSGGALSPAQASNVGGTDRSGSLGALLGPSDTSASLKSSFAFNVRFGKKGTNPKGDVVLIIASHNAPLLDAAGHWTGKWFVDRRVHYYQVHSTSIDSVALSGNEATFSCKANIVDTTERRHITLVNGATLQVSVQQNGAAVGNDAVNFNLFSPGAVWFNNDFGWEKNAGGGYSQANLIEPLAVGHVKMDS